MNDKRDTAENEKGRIAQARAHRSHPRAMSPCALPLRRAQGASGGLQTVPEQGTIRFFVPGDPKAQPRAKALRNGIVYVPSVADDWKHQVRAAFAAAAQRHEARDAFPIPAVPFRVSLAFVFARPASHWCTGKNAGRLRDSAPTYYVQKPDVDNLEKAVLDALGAWKGLLPMIWVDDAQVVNEHTTKRWTTGRAEGAGVRVLIEWWGA